MERYFVFDKFNTWYDWRLILTSKDVTPPEPKTNYINLDGMDGTLDLSESLTGEITYKDRTVSATFWTNEGTFKERSALYKKIVGTLHGKKINIIEPDDPDHCFHGRIKIKSCKNILPYMEFTIEATCEPWRYSLEDINRYVEVNSDKVTSLVINNEGVKTVCPDITVTGLVTIRYGEFEKTLTTGSYKIIDLKLRQGVNVVSVKGDGSVTFTYKEGDL